MQTQDMAREKQINFRVSDEEAERFETVATQLGLSLASMIRMLVKEKYDALEGTRNAAPSQPHTIDSRQAGKKRAYTRNPPPEIVKKTTRQK